MCNTNNTCNTSHINNNASMKRNRAMNEEQLGGGGDVATDVASAARKTYEGTEDAESVDSSSEPPSSGAGYSGDYSSISDSSENGGSQSKPSAVRDSTNGKNVGTSILKSSDGGRYNSRARRQRHSNKGGDEINNSIHNEHLHKSLPEDQVTGSNLNSLKAQDNSDEDINRKISEIMSLYKVSLQAQRDGKNAARANLKLNAEVAAMEAAKGTSIDRPLQVEGSDLQNDLLNNYLRASKSKISPNQDETHAHIQNEHLDSSECYANLVEACRPFFNDSRALITGELPPMSKDTAGGDEAHSSSGFTSFFTTTNQSGSNSNNTNGSGGSSNDSSNQKKNPQSTDPQLNKTSKMEEDDEANDTSSETSSLAVLARVKRKYKEQQRRTSSSNSDQTSSQRKNTSTSGKTDVAVPSKRVRIETAALDVARSKEKARSKYYQNRNESSSLTSSLSTGSASNLNVKNRIHESNELKQEIRAVTESSSGITTANNSSADGYSNQQKSCGNQESTGSDAYAGESQKEDLQSRSQNQSHLRHEKDSQTNLDISTGATTQDEDDALASKEKRSEKKRRRRESRREYEEELRQMRDSSENSSDATLEPGMPVTLEEVLSLTKTARLLVQALPPFLAVHINAAFTNLCGIQSSAIIGRPVASFLSLPSNKESESSGSDNANSREESDKLSSLSGSADDTGRNGSRAAIADGSRQAQGVVEAVVGDGNFRYPPPPPPGLGIDRIIVARGYGHIHNVELECHHLLQNHHPHSIEGSEVKFVEGNNNPSKNVKKSKARTKILCRMSVSPVTSSSARATSDDSQQLVKSTDSNSGNKRRKHKHPAELQCVKHYLIQLEASDDPRLLVTGTSFNSCSTDTTLEAQLLGVTKADVVQRRLESRLEQNGENVSQQGERQEEQQENEGVPDENSSSTMELVATCG